MVHIASSLLKQIYVARHKNWSLGPDVPLSTNALDTRRRAYYLYTGITRSKVKSLKGFKTLFCRQY